MQNFDHLLSPISLSGPSAGTSQPCRTEAAKHCELGRVGVKTFGVNSETLEIEVKGGLTLEMDDLFENVAAYWRRELDLP
jgi:hypothetical protein